jgi:hypothetical protein
MVEKSRQKGEDEEIKEEYYNICRDHNFHFISTESSQQQKKKDM